MDASRVSSVVRDLQACDDFATAAEVLLVSLLERLGEGREDARMLRATLHYRPSASYSAIGSVARHGRGWAREGIAGAAASSTAWLWLSRLRRALEFDLVSGEVRGILHAEDAAVPHAPEGEFTATDTIVRLAENGASHLLAFPLLSLRNDTLQGMVTVELVARQTEVDAERWSAAVHAGTDLVKLCTPWLAALPVRPDTAAASECDPHLPVVGEALGARLPMMRAFAGLGDHLLITGATGVGKSRLARWIHEHSRARSGPFEIIDFHAVPSEMQMAELVGWQKGAFTGAAAAHDGALQRAAGGTLLIDEVDKLSLGVQAGLLQILETGVWRPLGSAGSPQVSDARIIIGTNGDLPAMVRAGTFREDLYYRINVLTLRLDPLAERVDEIGPWARFMVREIAERAGHDHPVDVSDAAVAALEGERWPGNLRQLNNTLRRCYAIALTEAAGGAVEIAPAQVRLALDMDPASAEATADGLSGGLQQAADHFVDVVIANRRDGAPSDIDANDLFKGFVLLRALERMELDTREVYSLLGRERSVTNRNHRRDLRRELSRAMDLLDALGERDSARRIRVLLDDMR